MILPLLAFFALLPLYLCDISVVAFDDSQCAGDRVGPNIHSSPGAVHETSACQANGDYSSVNVLSLDPGFQCNLYADEQCQTFLATVKQVGCMPIIGKGINCFSQISFDDPLAGTKGSLGIGASRILVKDQDLGNAVGQLIDKACGNGICDTTTKDTLTYTHETKCLLVVGPSGLEDTQACSSKAQCTQTMTVDGHFSNTNQRDYMKEALKTAMTKGTDFGVFRPNKFGDVLRNQLSFAGVQINDAKGANLALVRSTLLTGLDYKSRFHY
jgi:hypothetical protein